jgi:hypothetical protein
MITQAFGGQDKACVIMKAGRQTSNWRCRLIHETLQEGLRGTVEARRAALTDFLADLDARIGRSRKLLDASDDAVS